MDTKNIVFVFLGVLFFAYMFAVPFSLFSEIPFMNLERLVFFPPKEKVGENSKPLVVKEIESKEELILESERNAFNRKNMISSNNVNNSTLDITFEKRLDITHTTIGGD